MKKRRAFWMPALLSGLFFITASVSYAEPGRMPVREFQRPPIIRLLPDLAVEDIRLDSDCRVVVKIRNNGPGVLPDNVWSVHTPKSAGIYLTVNGKKWGGETIWSFDTAKSLQAPGGTAEYTSNLKVSAYSKIRAEIDLWNVVAESNKANNVSTKQLSCGGVVPVTEDCITFNPETIEVKQIDGRWKIVDGSHWMFDFGSNKAEAEKAFSIIRFYRMNSSCFVGRLTLRLPICLFQGVRLQVLFPAKTAFHSIRPRSR